MNAGRDASWFIADLHLGERDPATFQLFLRWLAGPARQARELFILGDLFDAWIGDDLGLPRVQPLIQALAALQAAGVAVACLPGNRDFLLGEAFALASGVSLLPDPWVGEIQGERTLLMHGDLLCTDDVAYQQFRQQVRQPALINDFLAKPLEARLAIAAHYRQQSGEAQIAKADSIMDVTADTVRNIMIRHQTQRLIHGHTHRPADHLLDLPTGPALRQVLAPWEQGRGEVLQWCGQSWQRITVH